MKFLLKKSTIFFALALSAGITLCPGCGDDPIFKDPCKGVECGFGDCNDGTCECEPGATKDASGKCTILERDKVVGDYTISAPGTCSNNTTGELVTAGAPMSISGNSGSIKDISINIGTGIVVCAATVEGTSITIPEQTYNGRKYSGSGVFTTVNNKTRVELTLVEFDSALSITCTYTIFGV